MKTAIVWIITFVLFVFVRIILVEIGIIDSRQRVGGIIDGVILLGLIAFVQSCAIYLSKHRKDKVNYWCPLKNQALFTNDCFVGQPTFGMCRQTISGLKPRKMDEKYKKWHAFIASMSNTTHIF